MSEVIQSPAVPILQQAADGLMFQSETDAPLVPFFWPAETPGNLTPERLQELADIAPEKPVKIVKLETFFRPGLVT